MKPPLCRDDATGIFAELTEAVTWESNFWMPV